MPDLNTDRNPSMHSAIKTTKIKKALYNMFETTEKVKPWYARLKSGVPLSDPKEEASFQKWLKNRPQ